MSVVPNSLKKKTKTTPNPTESWGFSVLQTQRCLPCPVLARSRWIPPIAGVAHASLSRP